MLIPEVPSGFSIERQLLQAVSEHSGLANQLTNPALAHLLGRETKMARDPILGQKRPAGRQ